MKKRIRNLGSGTKPIQPQNNTQIISLAEANIPQFEEEYGKDWVTYGPYNSYFDYIEKAFFVSPTNGTIIDQMSVQMYGKGLAATNEENNMLGFQKAMQLLKPKDVKRVVREFKQFGQAALQIGYNRKHTEILETKHQPIKTLAPQKLDKNGEIKNYYYSFDWSNTAKYTPKKIPAFGTSGQVLEILYIKGYTPGLVYFNTPDYVQALQYAETEGEMSEFHLTNVKCGFSPSIMINHNNGQGTEESRQQIKRNTVKEFTGASGSKMIMSFNDSQENASTVDTIDIPNVHDQYQFLSDESEEKILRAHKVTSPLLVGIKDTAGFSSNAEEIKTAFQLWNATVIRPKQEDLTDAFQEVLAFNKLYFDLYFETLQPIEFTEDGIEKTNDVDEVQKETGIEMSKEDLDPTQLDVVLDYLAEDAPEGYEIYKCEDVGDEPEDLDYEILYNELETELSGAGVQSSPIKSSSLDSPLYKVRYRYKRVLEKQTHREFCSKIHSLSGNNKFFRKEDINFMSFKGVNNEFGHKGQNYSIWLYKGGVNCSDIWERVIFKKQLQDNGKPYIGNPLQNIDKEVKKAPGVKASPKKVTTAPYNMPNHGHHPNYKG